MEYLRNRYKNEIGYEYPSDNDPVDIYVEWLEGIIVSYEEKLSMPTDKMPGITDVHTREEGIYVSRHSRQEIQDMVDDDKDYIMLDVYTRVIPLAGSEIRCGENPTRPLCLMKTGIIKW